MEQKLRKPYTFDRVVRIVIVVAVVVALILLINRLKNVLLPFLVAWLFAYLINPLVEWNGRVIKLRKRALAIFVTFLEIVVAIALVGMLVIPTVVNETQHLYRLVAAYIQSSPDIPFVPQSLQESLREQLTLERIKILLSHEQWPELWHNLFKQATNIVSTSFHGLVALVGWGIVLLYIIFILQDYDAIIKGFARLIPTSYRPIAFKIAQDVKESMNRYFRGQALIATINGILHCIGFIIIGLPMAVPMGVLVGVLNLIPYMQVLSYIPAFLLCIIGAADGGANFWVLCGLTIVVFLVAQVIQEVYLTPRIMGNATGLNPAIILLSLSVWGSLLGFVGLIIALPLTSLLLAYYQRYIIDDDDIAKSNISNS